MSLIFAITDSSDKGSKLESIPVDSGMTGPSGWNGETVCASQAFVQRFIGNVRCHEAGVRRQFTARWPRAPRVYIYRSHVISRDKAVGPDVAV